MNPDRPTQVRLWWMGNRSGMSSGGGQVGYAYNGRNQLATVANGQGWVAGYQYNADGSRASKTLRNGAVTAYAYNTAAWLTNVTSIIQATGFQSDIAYGYNALGNRTSRTQGEGGTPFTDAYLYDATDQITNVTYGVNSQNTRYTYDAVGNRTAVAYSPSPSAFGLTSASYTPNNLNQYSIISGTTINYDANGNAAGFGSFILATNDARNCLVSASYLTNSIACVYDARNRCVSRTINGVTTYLYYDGWNLIEERDSTGAVVASYVHGANVDEMLMMTRGGTNYFYHADALGSVTHLSDATGVVVERYAYDVFGSPTIYDSQFTIHAASTVGNRFLFTGREYLAALGLYDYRHRIYMPMIGRFLQTDPIRFDAGDVNLYRYVGNNSVSQNDPLGLQAPSGPLPPGGLSFPRNPVFRRAFQRRDAGYDDKLNHCISSCEIAREYGEIVANALGVLKESQDMFRGALEWTLGWVIPKSWEDRLHDFWQGGDFEESVADSEANLEGLLCRGQPESCECCCKKRYGGR